MYDAKMILAKGKIYSDYLRIFLMSTWTTECGAICWGVQVWLPNHLRRIIDLVLRLYKKFSPFSFSRTPSWVRTSSLYATAVEVQFSLYTRVKLVDNWKLSQYPQFSVYFHIENYNSCTVCWEFVEFRNLFAWNFHEFMYNFSHKF